MKKITSALTMILATVFLITAFSSSAWSAVSGKCSNCHTMHNSQGGTQMSSGDPSPDAGFATLLTNDCVGCHTGTNNGSNTTPYVYSISEPTYGTDTLAGGNFYWVKTQDAKGHNVFADNPDSLTQPPGASFTCGGNDCHSNISEINPIALPGLAGRQGCTKCHMISNSADGPKGYHHADDSNVVVGSEAGDTDGFFRFLSGHLSADGHGVSGIEDSDWQYTRSASDHNEYLGHVGDHSVSSETLTQHTMTGFCVACHGNFHTQDTGSGWVRHPADAVIPNSGEYASAFGGTYDPDVPVARPSLSTVVSTVTPGTDMVMCLSCHAAHGSPYDDMLRWDYSGMTTGTTGAGAGEGCFKCHTEKDGI